MPKCDEERILKCRNKGCSKQFKEIKRILEENQSMLCEMKLRYRKQQLAYGEISQQLAVYQQAFVDISQQLNTQQEIMNLFYREYQSLKKRQGKEQLMNYIRMRDSMLKDMTMYETRHQTNVNGYRLLSMYVNELDEILEDLSVEILYGNPGMAFNAETQKPIERIQVFRPEENNLVCKVFNCGYRWDGIMLKKMDVAVCVYR